ncbi:polymer-forming cytoskeletal protein [Hyphomonadaceae bacterium ML37]|nr:polymer-forming cytoskeletal protein [Hyphomonadaceae bacterium ML37]
MKSSKMLSILAADMVVVGSISSHGDVQIDGRVEGRVQAGLLDIGPDGFIKGEALALKEALVRGRLEGQLKSQTVALASSASVQGEIVHAALKVEMGAFLEGRCRRVSDGDSRFASLETSSSGYSAVQPDPIPEPVTTFSIETPPGAIEAVMTEFNEADIEAMVVDASGSGANQRRSRTQPVPLSADDKTGMKPPHPSAVTPNPEGAAES